MVTCTGFPPAALDFYDDLEVDGTKISWEANRHIYQESVFAPMKALTAELATERSVTGASPHRSVGAQVHRLCR
jgi:uncharacterized protein (DUF2461 family)